MARDFWQNWKPVVEVRKINKSITIPAFSHECGEELASLYLVQSVSSLRTASDVTLSTTTFTIDFFAKLVNNAYTGGDYFIFQMLNGSGFGVTMEVVDSHSKVRVSIITSGGTYVMEQAFVFYGLWKRYTITFSATLNAAFFYVDGEQVDTVTTTANMSVNTYSMIFGEAAFLSRLVAYIDELRLFSTYRDAEVVKNSAAYRGTLGVSHYWKFTDIVTSEIVASVGAINLTAAGGYEITTEEYAPITYGASFVAAEYIINSGLEGLSLKFPVAKPTVDTNFSLVVRWLDDDGVTQRRRFWDVDGVDIAPFPVMYHGERLPEDFVFEIWNIDGEQTVDLAAPLVLRVSRTSHPTTSTDHTALVLDDPEEDTTLAEPFPLTPFPLQFNTQQTY